MAEKKQEKKDKIEREYIIPLRKYWKRVPRYKRANRAVKGIKEFLARHMKIRDRDLNKIKVDRYVNELLWSRGIKKPPAKIKVKATKEGDEVKVELVEFSEKLKFKKIREEKVEKKALDAITKKKSLLEKVKEEKPEEKKEEDVEKKEEEKEKKAAVVESGKEIEKAAAKKMKHQAGGKSKQPKRQQRKALAK